jgi:AbrB family looped-hinge helix DNA binding protein
MVDTLTVQVSQRGLITLPKALRDAYRIQEGDLLTLMDLGGVFLLSPERTEVDLIADQIKNELVESGQSMESMLERLREARQRYET